VATSPEQFRAELAQAEERAARKRLRSKSILYFLYALLAAGVIFVGYTLTDQSNQIKVLVQKVKDKNDAIVAQGLRIEQLQKDQAEAQATGRTTQLQVQKLVEQGLSFTSPTSTVTMEQQAKIAGYLASLAAANQAGINDQTRRIGEMLTQCRSLPCSPTIVSRIIGEPVPVPTFAGLMATPSAVVASAPAPSASPTIIPTSCPTATATLSITVNLQQKC
jgi:hypothetical protein